ncbi:MAG: DUF2189 domain-containing protein [Zoogloeaceae bacterium]|nr:DUF2189 domain-containing protein [Zoogloeaceae bacterium]
MAVVRQALAEGGRILCRAPGVSLTYGSVFALVGTLVLGGMLHWRVAPLALPAFGGFLLVGPVAMAGLMAIAAEVRAGRPAGWREVAAAWRAAPRGLWALAFFCMLSFFIALGDVGTLYSFLVGEPVDGWGAIFPGDRRWAFHLSAGASGGFLAAGVYLVTVHAVPLLLTRRASLVASVSASVRAVASGPVVHLVWAAVLASGVLACVVFPPALVLVLPLLAYAGDAFHRAVFPAGSNPFGERD